MKTRHHILSLLGSLLLMACSASRVTSNRLSTADLAAYNSYTVADPDDGSMPWVYPAKKRYLHMAIEKQAADLCTAPGNSGVAGPDVLISYFVILDAKHDIEAYSNYYGRRRWRYPVTEVEIRKYTEGTLLVDFIDARTNQLVWQGSLTGVLNNGSTKMERTIDKAVEALFTQYRKDQQL